jgi:glycosyltransferase involved in cell wall biosynthesis
MNPSSVPAKPDLSVVLCTYNPRRDILTWVLDALDAQTLDRGRWEFVVVDNNSSPPLDANDLGAGRTFSVRVEREPEQGKVSAYRRAVQSARAELICLIDDDNILDADYLENALRIAHTEPKIGVFGGVCRARFESRRCEPWKTRLLIFLGIVQRGDKAITSTDDKWGEWEPIGAGMCLRKTCGLKFLEMLAQSPEALKLDRSGSVLLSGGDSFLARSAYRCGYACSYQPSLQLTHFMKAGRLKVDYLLRIMYGHGKSVIMLNSALGLPWRDVTLVETLMRLMYRVMSEGFRRGPVWWMWDAGYYAECRARRKGTSAPLPIAPPASSTTVAAQEAV